MNKVLQKLILWFTWIIATIFTYIIPLHYIVSKLIVGQEMKAVYSIMTAVILFIVFIIISKWLMRIYDRKLQAIATAEEIGVVPATNFIMARFLKHLEIMLPIGIIAILLYGMTFIELPAHIVFKNVVLSMVIGLVIYLIHDGFKVYFMNQNKVLDAIKLDEDKERIRYRTTHRRAPKVKRRNK